MRWALHTTGTRIMIALYVAVGIPILCGLVWTIDRYERSAVLDDDANRRVRVIAGDLGRLDMTLTALASMQHARDQDDFGTLIDLARQSRKHMPAITAIGRYERLSPMERAQFELEMNALGLYDFRLHDILEDGSSRVSPRRRLAFPVSLLEPREPTNLRLLGTDLAGVDELATELARVSREGRTWLTTVPASWPGAGQLMMFRPVYRGLHTPRTESERVRQADGGLWLMVDPATLFATDDTQLFHFELTVGITQDGRHMTVFETAPLPPSGPLTTLRGVYAKRQSWPFGTARLDLGLRGLPGSSNQASWIALGLVILATSVLGLLLAMSNAAQRRRRDVEAHDAALHAEREQAERTLDAIGDAVLSVDGDMRVTRVNPAACILLARSDSELLGKAFENVVPLRHACDGARRFDLRAQLASLEPGVTRSIDLAPEVDTAGDTTLQATLSRVRAFDGGIVVLRDTSAERQFTRQLERQANHDALTGCTNRHHFEQRIETLLGDPRKSERHALLYLDLDQFKVVNDTVGHAAGDRLLIELTANLKAGMRDGDTLSRLGGDEFGLIISDASPAQATRIAERIYTLFQSLVFTHQERSFAVRASLGLVHFRETGKSISDIMAAADIACYAAKENGRNELFVYTATDETMAMRSTELNWLPRLEQALDANEFRLHAQPVALIARDGTVGEVTHFEFLLRLNDHDGREITPWQIIQAAERYGLMKRIDRWVIGEAIRLVADVSLRLGVRAGFSINLSGQSAADPTLIDFIKDRIEEHGVDPARLWFELTETAAITHLATARELTGAIRKLGAAVVLDDFGSGLSSFGYLKNLPIDVLKIDGQFVRNVANDPVDAEMVRAIAQIAHAMGISTVAEFVEDAAAVTCLQQVGIDYVQGYHIGRPLPLDEAIATSGSIGEALNAQALGRVA